MNADVRDVEALFIEAQRQTIHEKMHDLRMSRMAWAEADVVKDEMSMYQNALEKLGDAQPKRYAKTWTEVIGRRKG